MTGVILFRAQPFHNGHLQMVKTAYEKCKARGSELFLIVGSANKVGTERNPFSIQARVHYILGTLYESFSIEDYSHIHVRPLDDLTTEADNSFEWGEYLYNQIVKYTLDPEISIYYCDRPEIMLSWFSPEVREHICFRFLQRYHDISATKVRAALLSGAPELKEMVPNYVYEHRDYLENKLKTLKEREKE